jgi:hypothetical protein
MDPAARPVPFTPLSGTVMAAVQCRAHNSAPWAAWPNGAKIAYGSKDTRRASCLSCWLTTCRPVRNEPCRNRNAAVKLSGTVMWRGYCPPGNYDNRRQQPRPRHRPGSSCKCL